LGSAHLLNEVQYLIFVKMHAIQILGGGVDG
jgi:hypothetical protein